MTSCCPGGVVQSKALLTRPSLATLRARVRSWWQRGVGERSGLEAASIVTDRLAYEPAIRRRGSAGARPRSSRSCQSCAVVARRAPARARRARQRTFARRASRSDCTNCPTASGARARSASAANRCPPPTASSTARSASTRTSTHADRGGRARADVARRISARGMLEDVLLIALIDTGVPVWALDARGRRRRARRAAEHRGRAAGAVLGCAAAAGRPARRGRRHGGARRAVRRARAGSRGGRTTRESDAVRRSRSPACRRCTSRRPCGCVALSALSWLANGGPSRCAHW